MEVALKKSKITKSILKQCPIASVSDFEVSEVLGWVIYDNRRWIVCYSNELVKLTRYPFIRDIEKKKTEHYQVCVRFEGGVVPNNYKYTNEGMCDRTISILAIADKEVREKGQFFI